MRRILILDDNLTICLMLKSWLVKRGHQVETATSVEDAVKMIEKEAYDLILSDIRMPEVDGFEFLSWLKKYDSNILVIMMTSYADIETAVESIKMGAADYISKPINPEMLYEKIDAAFKDFENRKKAFELQQRFIKPEGVEFEHIYNKMVETIRNETHLLILGAPGTGKTTLSRFIYLKGIRYGKAYNFFDFELSVSDAVYGSKEYNQPLTELLENSKGGVLYLKNFQKPSLSIQSLLIDVISKKNNGDDAVQLLIASTETKEQLEKNLLPKLSNLLFESYVALPNLRGNKRAIQSYSEFFLEIANKELDKNIRSIESEVLDYFYKYPFNSNLQELKNLIFKACLLTNKQVIAKDILPGLFQKSNIYVQKSDEPDNKVMKKLKKEYFEKEKIEEALEISKGNKTMAASILNIDRKTLYNKIRLYKIELN